MTEHRTSTNRSVPMFSDTCDETSSHSSTFFSGQKISGVRDWTPSRRNDGRQSPTPSPVILGMQTARGPLGGIADRLPKTICPPIPSPDDNVTNRRFLFLREIGGPNCLKPFLDSVNELTKKDDNHPLARGTLIIDQTVTLTQPITIPRGYTLAGVGENGRGIIQVAAEFGGQPAIRIVNPFVTIRDLGIEAGSFGLNSGAIGIDLDPTGHIYLQNVRVASFGQYGLKAKDVGSVFVDKCQFVGNGNNLLMVGTAAFGIQSWRIRDSIIRDAKEWGIRTQGAGADLVIEGCRFEGNFFGGVRLGKGFSGAFIFGNRFEDNRTAEEKKVPIAGRGVRVDDGAISTRILCNLFSGDAITPSVPKIVLNPQEPQKANQATQIGFNVSDILEDAAFRVPL